MADRQIELLSQLIQEMKNRKEDEKTINKTLQAVWGMSDESERIRYMEISINGGFHLKPTDKPSSEQKLCYEIMNHLQVAGIAYDNPLYAQQIDDFWKADDKEAFVKSFSITENTPPSNDEQTFGEEPVTPPADELWKKETEEAFVKAATTHNQAFEKVNDEKNSKNLKFNFLDAAKKVNGSITYHNRNHVTMQSKEYNHFLVAVEASKNAGIKTITFGDSIKSPKYKAHLYMACLELGMKMKNPPKAEDIKNINPQLDKILTMQELRKEVFSARQKVVTAQKNVNADADCSKLLKEFKSAKAALNKDKDNQTLKDVFYATKKALNENSLYTSLNDAKHTETAAMKKALDYVVSQKPDAEKQTAKDRIKAVAERDLKQPSPSVVLTQKAGESDADFQSRQTRYNDGKAKRDADKSVQANRMNTQRVLKSAIEKSH